ncbi:MAG: hypothetical protein Q9160_005390 [Pyrenula sp. 1 TL-2023]
MGFLPSKPPLFGRRSFFEPPHLIERICSAPLTLFLQYLYEVILILRGPAYRPPTNAIKVVCVSDTHCKTIPIPDGDLLIHAGDLADTGSLSEIQAQLDWLNSLPHPHKILVCGNHDSYFDINARLRTDLEPLAASPSFGEVHYLQHESISVTIRPKSAPFLPRTLIIHGSPQIPRIGLPNFAFEYPRGTDTWSNTVPASVDILVTHTPPKWHHDLSHPPWNGHGCEWLLKECWRVKPTLHVFGHIHAAPGREAVFWDDVQRAYERVCERAWRRESKNIVDTFRDVFSFANWRDGLLMTWRGAVSVLWTRIWGGETRGGGWMVNAAATEWRSGQLKNKPQVMVL